MRLAIADERPRIRTAVLRGGRRRALAQGADCPDYSDSEGKAPVRRPFCEQLLDFLCGGIERLPELIRRSAPG